MTSEIAAMLDELMGRGRNEEAGKQVKRGSLKSILNAVVIKLYPKMNIIGHSMMFTEFHAPKMNRYLFLKRLSLRIQFKHRNLVVTFD